MLAQKSNKPNIPQNSLEAYLLIHFLIMFKNSFPNPQVFSNHKDLQEISQCIWIGIDVVKDFGGLALLIICSFCKHRVSMVLQRV